MPAPAGAARSLPASVSCLSPTDCTAVGYYADAAGFEFTLVEVWNGTAWSIRKSPNRPGQASVLHRVSCVSPRACTAVGSTTNSAGVQTALAETWNGTAWAIHHVPLLTGATWAELGGVSCVSAARCLAVGSYIYHHGPQYPLAESWNGTAWAIRPVPEPKTIFATLGGVSCTTSARCTAVGYYGNSAGNPVALAETLHGTHWTISYPPPPPASVRSELTSVWCTTSTACAAAGDYANSYRAFTETWNGMAWTRRIPARPAGATSNPLVGMWCSTPAACTAVGFYTNSSGTFTLAEAWNGTTWSQQPTPNPARSTYSSLAGLSCTSPAHCEAVGYSNQSGTYQPLAIVRRH